VRVALKIGSHGFGPGFSTGLADALADGDETAAAFGINAIHVGEELFFGERSFGHVDEMGAIFIVLAGQNGGGGEEAGMAAHDDVNLDAGQGAVVVVVAHDGGGDEPGCRAKAGRVIVDAQIVVDGLGNVEDLQLVALLGGKLADDSGSVG